MRAMVLWTINDFPARSSLSGWSRQDTVKERQDLKRFGIRSDLWLGQTKNGKCLKPQAAYSFTPENRKKFCQFIKGVKLPDGFGSCFKHKVTDNDTNITGLKSHDCHIMMQRLLPYELQNYLPEALEGEPIRPQWMFPYERYMKKSPEIDTYRSQFKSLFPNKDMKEEFLDWFGSQIRQCHVDNDKDPELQEILEFKYLLFKVVLFRVKWFDTRNQGRKVKRLVLRNNMTQINTRAESFKDDQYILTTKGVIVVEDDLDIIHFDNSSDLPLFASLNDLDNATLNIDGQTTKVDVPPNIIDVVDEDDDITNDEDALPHDLVDYDNEDLINVDDDCVDKMSADVSRSYDGDSGGEDRPLHTMYPTVAWVALLTEAKANESPIWAARQRACNTLKMGRSGITGQRALHHRSLAQDMRTTSI
nr:hypothetical protein [Tanacetum cinerariifolium]